MSINTPNISSEDYKYMARAIQLAKKGQYTTHPNPNVGCVIVKDNIVIGEGFTQPAGQEHAEIHALANCSSSPEGATAYVTLEPCSHTGKTPPCADALVQHKLARVVIGATDPNPNVSGKGAQRLRDNGIIVDTGVLEDQARLSIQGFIKRMEKGMPWVRVKLAMSLDGKTAMASGESKWITGAEARYDVQLLRAKADAVLTGVGTVLADDPSLNVRLSSDELGIDGEVRQPKRVILDTHLKTPVGSKLLSLDGENLFFTGCGDEKRINALKAKGAEVFNINSAGRLPLKTILQQLAEIEVNEVHVEAGATLCGALIEEGLVDEIIIYMAPIIMGADARGLLSLPAITAISDKVQLEIKDIRAVGNDWRITARPKL